MGKAKKFIWALILCHFIFIPGIGFGDESSVFTASVNPDVLIILDWSGSMGYTPAGGTLYTRGTCNSNDAYYPTNTPSHSHACTESSYGGWTWNGPMFAESTDTNCAGPFYVPSGSTSVPTPTSVDDANGWDGSAPSGYTLSCTRLAIAQRAIRSLLDADGNGVLNTADFNKLKIRFGYMRFRLCQVDSSHKINSNAPSQTKNYYYDSDMSTVDYNSGCIKEKVAISDDNYNAINTSVNSEKRGMSFTPNAAALNEAKKYLDDTYNAAIPCRKRFAILITDGGDTLACPNVEPPHTSATDDMWPRTETNPWNFKNRKSMVAAAKALHDANYQVFMVGFGSDLTNNLRNTMEWAAYHGGTSNPLATQSGDTGAISVSANPCETSSANDPGATVDGTPNSTLVNPLGGYAFFALNPTDLATALQAAMNVIQQSTYSFSASSVGSARISSENFLYDVSFKPMGMDPLWQGSLGKYQINDDGGIAPTPLWDAGTKLKAQSYSSRKVYTFVNGSVTSFSSLDGSSNCGTIKDYFNFGNCSDTNKDKIYGIVRYILGDSAYNPDNWKLGDTFHSNPIYIGSPSAYYYDTRSPAAYNTFRTNHTSTTDRPRTIVLGANDGQFHAFDSDGNEKWSFIPPNLLSKLQYLAHKTEPTLMQHTYFVDGPVTVADVWVGSGTGKDTAGPPPHPGKYASEWKTLLVFGEGKGVRDSTSDPTKTKYLWSSSPYCDQNFNPAYIYSSTYHHYCGYYALDMTDTSVGSPAYMWTNGRLTLTHPDDQGPYLGEPWSRMAIGRVIIGGHETWVGFIGGGYNNAANDTRGRGFFVVRLSDGSILWSYTKANNESMSYSIPAAPEIYDWDGDGFIDAAYVGDVGGNMWRFTFCTAADGSSCGTGNWSGGKLFNSEGVVRPIYKKAALARDTASLWVFWGTGDQESPQTTGTSDAFFAIKDKDRSTTGYTISNLQSATYTDSSKAGWYYSFPNTAVGEKMVSDPTVFAGIALFTTYTPPLPGHAACDTAGTSALYAMAMMNMKIGGTLYVPGDGVLALGAKSQNLGQGMAQTPVFSQRPSGNGTDFYLKSSGSPGQGRSILTNSNIAGTPLATRLGQTGPASQVIHWRDGRLQ